jgi:hypothetical protein
MEKVFMDRNIMLGMTMMNVPEYLMGMYANKTIAAPSKISQKKRRARARQTGKFKR